MSAENEGSGSGSGSRRGKKPKKADDAAKGTAGRKRDKPHTWLSDELATSLVAEAEFTPTHELGGLLKRYGVSARTYERKREKCQAEPRLARIVEIKVRTLRTEWSDVAVRFMRRGIAKLEELVASATVKDLYEVAGAVKIVGDLSVARTVFPARHGQLADPDQSPPTPSENEGSGGRGGEADPEVSVH